MVGAIRLRGVYQGDICVGLKQNFVGFLVVLELRIFVAMLHKGLSCIRVAVVRDSDDDVLTCVGDCHDM